MRGLGSVRPQAVVLRLLHEGDTALLSEFGLGHVREYAPFGLILSALHLILRAKSQHICFKCARMALRATFSV